MHKPLIKFNFDTFKKYNVSIHPIQIYIENRDYIFNHTKFEGKIHMDSLNNEGLSCYTVVYYFW